MKKILLFPIWAVCLSLTIGCNGSNNSNGENVTIVIDSIDSTNIDVLKTDSITPDSLQKDSLMNDSMKVDILMSELGKDTVVLDSAVINNQEQIGCQTGFSTFTALIIGALCFVLGIILTLCSILLIKKIKNKKSKTDMQDAPIIQAEVISEVEKNDEILKGFIIEK